MPENKNEEIQEEINPEETVNPEADSAQEEIDTEETCKAEAAGEDIELESAIAAAEKAEAEVKSRLVRLQADFENYKKRTQKEKSEVYTFAMDSFMTKLLPVIDNLERAEAAADDDSKDSYREGVQMVFKELMNVLNGEGLQEIDALGKAFDPNFHHGVAVGEDVDKPDQEILEVFQKGYLFKEKVIRAAMVKVNQK